MRPDRDALANRDPLRVFRLLALAATALTFVAIVASAYIRHSQGYVRCIEWPACEARATDPLQSASAPLTAARIAHRLAATLAGLAVLAMPLFARSRNAQQRSSRRFALVALALVIALAAFGATTGESTRPLVALGNVGGGYALLVVLVAAHARAAPDATASLPARTAASAALLLVFAQAAQVALTGGAQLWLPYLHRGVAIGCAALVLAAAWSLRHRPAAAAALVGALGVTAITGAMEAGHSASAALLAALLAHAAARRT